MAKRPVDLITPAERCERGCGKTVAVTRRRDDAATRLSTIDGSGRVQPGDHNVVYHDARAGRGRQ